MSTIKLDIVTAERVVFSDDVDIVVAPGSRANWVFCRTMPR